VSEHEEDEALVRLCLQGDQESWRRLALQCGPSILAAAKSVLRSRGVRDLALAEEVAQDSLAALAQDGGRLLRVYDGRTPVASFLAAIAGRRALHALRSRSRHSAAIERARIEEAGEREEDEPTEGLEREETSEAFARGLAELAPSDRLLLTLYYLDERSYAEIAAVTGLAATGIGTKISRARARLAEVMKRQGFEPS
jgi:RNA polymerase sigma-70 factor (ECF subfamily)